MRADATVDTISGVISICIFVRCWSSSISLFVLDTSRSTFKIS